MTAIPHSRPYLGEPEARATYDVVMSRHLAAGDKVREFEQQWAAITGSESAAMVASGLSALRLALLALGVGSGDEVIIPAYSCVALANAVLAVGARPVLADVVRDRWVLDAEDALRRMTHRTKAGIAVDLFGLPCDVHALINDSGVRIIQDMAHGPSMLNGDLGIASFYPTKYLAASRGGVVFGSRFLVKTIFDLRSFGDKTPAAHLLNDLPTDVDAAMVLEQMKRLCEIGQRRRGIAIDYGTRLEPLVGLVALPAQQNLWYRYTIRLTHHHAPDIVRRMQAKGVMAEQPVWDLRETSVWNGDCPVTSEAFDRVISLPLYPDLTPDEQSRVVDALTAALKEAAPWQPI